VATCEVDVLLAGAVDDCPPASLELVDVGRPGVGFAVEMAPTQTNAADPIAIPLENERHTSASPVLSAGYTEGDMHISRSEMYSVGRPLFEHGGNECATIADAPFVSKHELTARETFSPFA